ncbi:CPBP family glutamic-type intramembrane protease [Enterococcus sp. AZ007]|uniref:CPBP family glutamic-type intramembrane protease n=1 Tax=Enterococcus sp. AZ007 TaxID=2774839 RepID=UPI003F22C01A
MKKIVIKYPLTLFYLLTILITILIGAPQIMLFPDSLKTGLMTAQWGPALGAFVVAFSLDRKIGITRLLKKITIRNTSFKYLIIAIVLPMILCIFSYFALTFVVNGKWVNPDMIRSFPSYVICMIATIFSVTGEEIGWRGFMLPKMLEKYSLFTSSLIIGVLWGVWHFRFQSISLALLYILAVTEFSFISSWLYVKTNNNIVASILFHTSINMGSTVLFEKIMLISNPEANLQMNTLLYGIYSVFFAIPALYIIIQFMRKRQLSSVPR